MPEVRAALEAQSDVLARFGPTFAPSGVGAIDAEEFQAFLAFRNNKHWTGLERHGPRICADMGVLREALSLLLDERVPIAGRLTEAADMVSGIGKAVATAVLHVAHPDRYGVWNNTSEGGMKTVGLWPAFDRGLTFGERYALVNDVLQRTAAAVGVDLWTLDALWYVVLKTGEPGPLVPPPPTHPEPDEGDGLGASRFGLERHLQDFLRDNWARTSIGEEWEFYTEPGDPEAGYEYPCDVGRIDLLARHRERGDWLVIELKRGQGSDQTVGQVLRYVGWVRRHLAEGDEEVRGLIVARGADDQLRYAVDTLPFVDLQFYEVEFTLRDAPALQRS